MSTDTKNTQKTPKNTWYGSAKKRVAVWKQVKNSLTHEIAQKLQRDVDKSRSEWK